MSEFYFSHVEISDTTDFEVFMDDLGNNIKRMSNELMILGRTVGVFRWVLDNTMSKKSAAVGTGAIAFRPLVDMVSPGVDGLWLVGSERKKIRFLTIPHDLSC